MRRLVMLAVVGGLVAAAAPAFAAPTATLPGCAAVNPGKATCTFTILKSDKIPAGVLATTTWKITGGGHTWTGKLGKTTIVFPAGVYTLTATGKGFAGAGKAQA
ncbi:MAG: hypothetical protein ACJ735_07880 [Actinomycetes bacterium]